MKIKLFAATALVCAVSIPAAASAASSTFTGPRAEIFGGADRLSLHERDSETFSDEEFGESLVRAAVEGPTTTDTESFRTHKTGGIGGAELGYDFGFGDKLVVGAFGSFALPTTKICEGNDEDGFGCLKTDREIEGGARVGFRLSPSMLLYGKGGYVRTRFKVDGEGLGDDGISTHINRSGWRAGAGAEFALNQHAYVKVEYDYTKYKTYRADFDFGDEDFIDTESVRVRLNRMQAHAGFGVRF